MYQRILVPVDGSPTSNAGLAEAIKLAKLTGARVAEQVQEWGADVIVLGTHGRRGVGRMLLGSDAEQIVRTATVPVLLVRGTPSEADHAAATSPTRARLEPI